MTESSINKSTYSLKPLFIILIILIILLALGCSKTGQEIAGVWDNVKGAEIVEFKADGTGVFTYPNSRNPPLTFSWEKASTHNYILDVNFRGNRNNLSATIHDKQLSIESTLGKELYKKNIGH